MGVPNARGVVKNLDYHVYHYLRPARPLCLGNPELVCWKDGCNLEVGMVLPPKDGQGQQHTKGAQTSSKGCKHVHIKDTNWALNMNSENIERQRKKLAHAKNPGSRR